MEPIGIALIAAAVAFVAGMFVGEWIGKESGSRDRRALEHRNRWLTGEAQRLRNAVARMSNEHQIPAEDMPSIVRAARGIRLAN